jgi:hypothetical protein
MLSSHPMGLRNISPPPPFVSCLVSAVIDGSNALQTVKRSLLWPSIRLGHSFKKCKVCKSFLTQYSRRRVVHGMILAKTCVLDGTC